MANPETPDKNGATPAYMAAQYCHVSILQLLGDSKTSLETHDKNGATPAYMVAQNGHISVLRLLDKTNRWPIIDTSIFACSIDDWQSVSSGD